MKDFCKRGHPRTPENLEGHRSCVLCRRVSTAERRKKNPGIRYAEIAYRAAKIRCTHPGVRGWKYYGGRGIEFRFQNFKQFLDAVGPHPGKGFSLDRIDNDGHYEVGNVKWATREEQAKNRNYLRHCTDDSIFAEIKRRGLLGKAVSLLQENVVKEIPVATGCL